MDLKGMLNEHPAEGKAKKESTDNQQRDTPPRPPPPLSTGVNPPPAGNYGLHPAQHPSPYAPSSSSPAAPPFPQNHTPPGPAHSRAPGSGQYPPPPPPHAVLSPAGAQQHRPYEQPFARPPSHGYQYPPPAASPNAMAGIHGQPPSSLSPTPPSTHSPYAPRQSPLAARIQAPSHMPHQHPYPHPQNAVPLGPPTLQHRHTGPPEMQSPFHQRTYSGASNGLISPYPAGNAPFVGSPSTYNRPPSQQRQSSDYLSHVQRERSESVSPKTKVPPRPPSLESRSSSQQLNTLTQPNTTNVVQQAPFAPPVTPGSQVPHPIPASAAPNAHVLGPPPESSLSPQRPPLIHHSSSKMGMSHLLTPTSEVPPVVNGGSAMYDEAQMKTEAPSKPTDGFVKPSPKKSFADPPMHMAQRDGTSERSSSSTLQSGGDSRPALKRSADSEIFDAPPSKQRRMRKYTQRPTWAQLSRHNPRFNQQDKPLRADPQPNGGQARQPNGEAAANGPPWTQNPPLDHDLIHTRQVLGTWEKTFKWNTPYPDVLKAVQDWLFIELEQLGDVGQDAREGIVEIEAKFGTLMRDDERYTLPVMNACVVHPQANKSLRFESTMTEAEHKHMNGFLNDTIKASMEPGRVRMSYQHVRETDSFHALSELGQKMLPQSIQRRQGTRQPRLRITRRHNKDGTSPITARIVKIPISNLHIANPGWNYDCRISINVEVNLDRPDLDLDSLVVHDAQHTQEVDRKKDRIAYKHLAYSIDLTKVERQGLEASHELELEVDSNVLREQMALMKSGCENAFGDVVSGFLDDAVFLMRTRPPPAAMNTS